MRMNRIPLRTAAMPVCAGALVVTTAWFLVETTRAECPVPPIGTVEVLVVDEADNPDESAIGMDNTGRFIVGWDHQTFSDDFVKIQRYSATGVMIGLPEGLAVWPGPPPEPNFHYDISIALSRSGMVRAAWLAVHSDGHPTIGPLAVVSDFDFDDTSVPVDIPSGPVVIMHDPPSAGMSDVGVAAVAYINNDGYLLPSVCSLDCEVSGLPSPFTVRSWDPCRGSAPCVSMRSDGCFCLVWVEAEEPGPGHDIALQLYGADGSLIDQRAGPDDWANEPDQEFTHSSQVSPAVALDDAGNIVVTWFGPGLPGCARSRGIYARRFHWAGGPSDPIVRVSTPFIVDSQLELGIGSPPLDAGHAHPTVALTLDETRAGRFVIAWNANYAGGGEADSEVHAQYFEADGRPLGCEFRVNQATDAGECDENIRRIAPSGRHTLVYGPDDQVAATWTQFFDTPPCDGYLGEREVYFTLLPGGYADALDAAAPCLKGDVNRDGSINGLDIQPFVELVIGVPGCLSLVGICPADVDGDADVDIGDVGPFAGLFLGMP
ncbi:MAG: hypothetical protein ABII12_07915 [Planctomycetota bacterium]